MITKNSINEYKGVVINGGESYLYIPPNVSLRSYISHYCISFPTQETMSDKYTVLPSANSVICVFVSNRKINIYYNGTNTKAALVGASANKNELLLLIKFHASGFFPFYDFNQDELVDFSLNLSCIDKSLSNEIENIIEESKRIEDLTIALDYIFIKRLKRDSNDYITAAINKIIAKNGNITINKLSEEMYYSEKHIRRLFLKQIGVSPKNFSRIVRVNYALQLLQNTDLLLTDIAIKTGFFDQPHFIHDFKSVCGLTPQEYLRNMSDFYNYNFKI